jgi:nicotinate phosphoribosyltransferase
MRVKPPRVEFPVEAIKRGFYSDKYFYRTELILKAEGRHPRVTMQVFPREDCLLAGIYETLQLLSRCADSPEKLTVRTLAEGETAAAREPVMQITGDYATFASLETIYLGILARRTGVATAVRRTVDAAAGREVLFFPARFDHYSQQEGDGYAAALGGASGVSTDAGGAWVGAEGLGTIPHGLIAAYDGDTAEASLAFDRNIPKEVRRIALVDFDNDCVEASLATARALGDSLWGVRLDNADDLWDVSVKDRRPETRGVCPELVHNVRRVLDAAGFESVKIVISGGFTPERIARFVAEGTPFDAVGVGSYYMRFKVDFTADIVMVNDKPIAKVGRKFIENPRLETVTLPWEP